MQWMQDLSNQILHFYCMKFIGLCSTHSMIKYRIAKSSLHSGVCWGEERNVIQSRSSSSKHAYRRCLAKYLKIRTGNNARFALILFGFERIGQGQFMRATRTYNQRRNCKIITISYTDKVELIAYENDKCILVWERF